MAVRRHLANLIGPSGQRASPLWWASGDADGRPPHGICEVGKHGAPKAGASSGVRNSRASTRSFVRASRTTRHIERASAPGTSRAVGGTVALIRRLCDLVVQTTCHCPSCRRKAPWTAADVLVRGCKGDRAWSAAENLTMRLQPTVLHQTDNRDRTRRLSLKDQ